MVAADEVIRDFAESEDRMRRERDAWRELAEALEAAQTASVRSDTTDDGYRAAWVRVRVARGAVEMLRG